jgi:GGDEF domain-containing protein
MECDNFLKKHIGSKDTVSGPYIENDRWVVEIKRKQNDIEKLLLEKLRDGGRQAGVAELISKTVRRAFEVKVDQQIMKLYSSNPEFAVFLSDYLKAKPRWLNKVDGA